MLDGKRGKQRLLSFLFTAALLPLITYPNPGLAFSGVAIAAATAEPGETAAAPELAPQSPDAMKSPFSDATLSLTESNELLAQVSRYPGVFTVAGMPVALYDQAMAATWQAIAPPENAQPLDLTFEISTKYNYQEYERFILNFANYDYVTVYNMGFTDRERAVYNIEIFNPSADVDPAEVVTIMINGGTHANETMATHVTVKMAEEFIQRLQSDETLQEYATRVRITILPCLNPDGRELVYEGASDFDLKSNAAGIDLNRNFPALNAGVMRAGNDNPLRATAPGLAYYPGDYLGEAAETRIAMKWINHYLIQGNACMLLDFHQYGNGIYFIKPFDLEENKVRQTEFYHFLKESLSTGSGTYRVLSDSSVYGYDGTGGTLTDYAFGVALGFPYSSQYGRQVLIINEREASLHEMNSLNDYANVIQPLNPDFVYATIEMTASNDHKGFSASALNAQQSHYENYNYRNLLENLMERTLGLQAP